MNQPFGAFSLTSFRSQTSAVSSAVRAAMAAVLYVMLMEPGAAASDHRDTLDREIAASDTTDEQVAVPFDVHVGDQEIYDDNLFRLPTSVASVTTVVGPGASRQDHINSSSVGLEDQWTVGRQIINLNLSADENRFARNTDLDNVSSSDKVLWTWRFGPQLTGEVGADYLRFLPDFVNTNYYHLDIYQRSEFFQTLRYQVGPHWGLFGGLMESEMSLSADAAATNDSHSKSAEVGFDYATALQNSFGFAYRYTDNRAPNSSTLNGVTFEPDYREESERVIFKYLPTEKTLIDASAGYIDRRYPSGAIGSFTGDIWRVAFQWQPTQKTEVVIEAWRQLQAYLTSETDYYVSKGVSVAPVWRVSEKINLSVEVSWDTQDYIGTSNEEAAILGRRDKLTGEQLIAAYNPIERLTVNFTVGESKRASNEQQFTFDDKKASLGFSVKFR